MIDTLSGGGPVADRPTTAGPPPPPSAADAAQFAHAMAASREATRAATGAPQGSAAAISAGDQMLQSLERMRAQGASASAASASAALPYGGVFYGNAVSADGIYPVKVGYGRDAAFRFRAELTGEVEGIRVNNRVNKGNETSYSKGDGGRIVIELRADDGSPQHLPSNTVLARSESYVPAKNGEYPYLEFDHPPHLEAGQIYHYVMVQLEPGAVASTNANVVKYTGGVHDNPYFGDVFNVFYEAPGGGWQLKRSSSEAASGQLIPTFELDYAGGVTTGSSMMAHKAASDAVAIDPSHQARQLFRVDGPDKQVTGLWLRPARISGGDEPLELTLRDGDGRIAWQGSIPADQISRTGGTDPRSAYMDGPVGWVYARFPATVTLESGHTYAVELGSSGKYAISATTDLSSKSAEDRNLWDSGYAQMSTDGGRSWTGWTKTFGTRDEGLTGMVRNATSQDLPILFTLEGKPGELPRIGGTDYGSWTGVDPNDDTPLDTTLGLWPEDLMELLQGPMMAQLMMAFDMVRNIEP